MSAEPRPADQVEVAHERFDDDGDVPNNPRLPVVIMNGALPEGTGAAAIRALFEGNGWGGTWTYTVFDYHHYHPNAHEVLGVAAGSAELKLGGPSGRSFRVSVGDVLVLPAGTGHCRLDSSSDFAVCGGYPPGQEDYDTVRADAPRGDADDRIARVPLPETDPVYGAGGPLIQAWS